jgi:hypothetical protein
MATVDSNYFEIQRRGFQWSKNSTLDDGVTSMIWDSDPNNAVSGNTAGETKLVEMPIGAQFMQSTGILWLKTTMPNTWINLNSGSGTVTINPTILTFSLSTANGQFLSLGGSSWNPASTKYYFDRSGTLSNLTINSETTINRSIMLYQNDTIIKEISISNSTHYTSTLDLSYSSGDILKVFIENNGTGQLKNIMIQISITFTN